MSPMQGAQGWIPGQGTRSCVLQLKIWHERKKKKIWHAAGKIEAPTFCDQDLVQPNK